MEKQLEEILHELRTLRSEILPRLERLESHIDFIEDTYDGLRNPLNYIKGIFKSPITTESVQPDVEQLTLE